RVAVPSRGAREELAHPVGGRDHPRRFGRIERERLLAQDVFARFERGHGWLGVRERWRADDDRVDVRSREQVGDRLRDVRYTKGLRRRLGTIAKDVKYGHALADILGLERVQMGLRNRAGSDNPDAYLGHVGRAPLLTLVVRRIVYETKRPK